MNATIYSAADNSPIVLNALKGVTVLCTVPAAFSGTCTSLCVPSIVQQGDRLKEAGAERVIVVSGDQPFAILEWVKSARWENADLEFASDYGDFELLKIVGKLSDEEGKSDLPPLLGNLMRRSYSVLKDGALFWQYRESDTKEYTLDPEDLIAAVQKASAR